MEDRVWRKGGNTGDVRRQEGKYEGRERRGAGQRVEEATRSVPRESKATHTAAIISQHETNLRALHLNGGMNSNTDSCKRKSPAA